MDHPIKTPIYTAVKAFTNILAEKIKLHTLQVNTPIIVHTNINTTGSLGSLLDIY